MWRQMRVPSTQEEKMELWSMKRAELEKCAVEQGDTLGEPSPMMRRNASEANG